MSKIVIIGANHAGTAAANTILDNYKGNELVILDKNSNISYLGCGTALWVGRQIDGADKLFYSNKETLEGKGATVHMETNVTDIDYDKKIVKAVSKSGKAFEESYDKLIIATGSLPINPNIPGIDKENIHVVKLYQDGQVINDKLSDDSVKKVAVVGAGYIGVEVAEAVERRGKSCVLIDTADTCLSTYYDSWFTDEMNENLKAHGIQLQYNETVTEIKGDKQVSSIVTDKGEYDVDLVLMAIGFRPNSAVAKDKLKLFKNGAIEVNLQQETSVPDVYAIGDCATIFNNGAQSTDYIALATNAVRSGIIAGHNVCGTPLKSIGVQGSNGIQIYGLSMVSTGLSVSMATARGINAVSTEFEDYQKPGFMRDNNEKVKIRIVYDKDSRRVIGAQLSSRDGASISGINHMFSLAINDKATIETIQLLDIFFMPHFNQPYNYITMAALSATE